MTKRKAVHVDKPSGLTKFVWRASGRRFIADVGPLWITVRKYGLKGEHIWKVDQVFGKYCFEAREYDFAEEAMLRAEVLAAHYWLQLNLVFEPKGPATKRKQAAHR